MTFLFDTSTTVETIGTCALALTSCGWAMSARRRRGTVAANKQLHEKLTEAAAKAATNQAALEADAAAKEAEAAHLAGRRLPDLIDVVRGYPDVTLSGLAHPQLAGTPLAAHHEHVLRTVQAALETQRADIARSARSIVRDLLEEPLTLMTRSQNAIFEEMEKYGDRPQYVQSLMGLDHLITLTARSFQRLRIVGGSWPGQIRSNATLFDIVEGGARRIEEHTRVHHTYNAETGNVWIKGRFVEPLAVALAELVDNAVAFTHATAYVSVLQVQAGYCIVVEDSGPGLPEEMRQRAADTIAAGAVLDVTSLTDSIELGWHVVGRLCHEYGFRCGVTSPSDYGGAKAIILVPLEFVGEALTPEEEAAARRPSSTIQGSRRVVEPDKPRTQPQVTAPVPATTTVSGLPQRRRRRPLPAEERQGPRYQAEDSTPEEFGQGIAQLANVFRTDTADTEGTN